MNLSTRSVGHPLVWVGLAAALTVAPQAEAVDDVMTLDIGAYRFDASTDIGVSGETRRGNVFNIENQGAPDNDTIFRMDGTFRLFERHRLRFMYFQSTREGEGFTDREISFQDSFIPEGTSLRSEFSLRQAELDYLYSFWKSESTEIALSLGVHATRLEASLSAPSLDIARTASATGPLPMIGLAATTRLGQRWELMGHVYGMAAEVNDFSGDALAYRVGGRYFFTPHIGIGLAWAGIKYDFDLSKSDWLGELDASNNGGQLFLTVRF